MQEKKVSAMDPTAELQQYHHHHQYIISKMTSLTKPGISTGSEQAPTCTFIPTAAAVLVGSLHNNTLRPLGSVYVSYWRLSNGGRKTRSSSGDVVDVDTADVTVDDVCACAARADESGREEVANREKTRRRRVRLSASKRFLCD